MTPHALTVRRFCELHAIGRTTFYEEVKAGRLRTRKVGARTLVLSEDAEDWRRRLPGPDDYPFRADARPCR